MLPGMLPGDLTVGELIEKLRAFAEPAETGVLNATVHLAASLQAVEALKLLLGKPTTDGLITVNAWDLRLETFAVKKVFGDYAACLPISSTKSMTGHMLGAAGGVETGIAALAVSRGVLPPTINYENKDPECDLDYVPNQAREVRVDDAISNSFGFGGTNACLAVKRFAG